MPQKMVEQCTELTSERATQQFADRLANLLKPGDAVLLFGPLGAGKSTLARALIRGLANDPGLEVPSPTFTLVQSYDLDRASVWHFDLYRLNDAEEVIELGWDDALHDIVVVEWPERLGRLRPRDRLELELSTAANQRERRRLVMRGFGSRGQDLVEALNLG